jgi:hypothetical protein
MKDSTVPHLSRVPTTTPVTFPWSGEVDPNGAINVNTAKLYEIGIDVVCRELSVLQDTDRPNWSAPYAMLYL